MSFAYREVATPSMVLLVAGISIGLMVIVAVLGPMRTLLTLTLVQRLAYCGVITIFAVPVLFTSGFFIVYTMRNCRVLYVTFALVLMCAVVVVPCSALAIVLYGVFHEGGYPTDSHVGVYLSSLLISSFGTGFAFYVLYQRVSRTTHRNSVSSARSQVSPVVLHSSADDGDAPPAPGDAVSDGDGTDADSAHSPGGVMASDLTETTGVLTSGEAPSGSASGQTPQLRLPPGIGRDIVYAHVSGHYVEVVTTSGTAVVYTRLSDVAGALEGQGIQTHRSCWAAYRHILRMQTDGHRTLLHLTDSHRVPVGRSFRDSVRAYLKRRRAP